MTEKTKKSTMYALREKKRGRFLVEFGLLKEKWSYDLLEASLWEDPEDIPIEYGEEIVPVRVTITKELERR